MHYGIPLDTEIPGFSPETEPLCIDSDEIEDEEVNYASDK
jgi:hypothetical protein